MVEQITLYTAKVRLSLTLHVRHLMFPRRSARMLSVYAHFIQLSFSPLTLLQVEIALEEAGAKYTKFQVDLQNKPEWYAPKVNPASKVCSCHSISVQESNVCQVPAVAYGGPDVPPDQPSPESTKIAESLVLLEFVADLFPESGLLPRDPVERARVRFFIDAVSTKFSPGWSSFVQKGESNEGLIAGLEALQNLLSPQGPYAIGSQFTLADVAILPFIARLRVLLKNDIGAYKEGEGLKTLEILTSPRFARLQAYKAALFARKSFQDTFDEVSITDFYSQLLLINLSATGICHRGIQTAFWRFEGAKAGCLILQY